MGELDPEPATAEPSRMPRDGVMKLFARFRSARLTMLALMVSLSACRRTPENLSNTRWNVFTRHAHKSPTKREPEATKSTTRWVAGEGIRLLGDGTRGAVIANRRVSFVGDKALLIDEKAIDDLGSPYALPTALGAGYLFVGKRSVRFAPSFAEPLATIATGTSDPFEWNVSVGRSCVLVKFDSGPAKLYELPTGKPLPLSPPGLTELFGTPQGIVAARVKGTLYVSMSNQTPEWRVLLSPPVTGLAYDGKGVVVETSRGTFRIGPDGKLEPKPNEPGMTVTASVEALAAAYPDVTRPLPKPTDIERLVSPFARLMDEGVAITIEDNALLFLDSSTGRVVHSISNAFDGRENCFLIRGGHPSFAGCNGDAMSLFRIDSDSSKPTLERSIKGIYTHTFGDPEASAPLAFVGRCDGTADKVTFCIRESASHWKELTLPEVARQQAAPVNNLIHVAMSKEGWPYAFGWVDYTDTMVIIDGATQTVRKVQTGTEENPKVFVDWDSVTIESGTIRFLARPKLSNNQAPISDIFADNSVHVDLLDGMLGLSGPRALRVTPGGKLFETLDAGKSFHELEPPPGGVPDVRDAMFGCHETGCIVGPWYRVGWSKG